MPEDFDGRVRALFERAADLSPSEQEAFLVEACREAPAVRAAVERLLAFDRTLSGGGAGDFLESPLRRAGGPARVGPEAPRTLGHYRLIRLLGTGGTGAVYEAEQESPRRTVALKVIHAGLSTPGLWTSVAAEPAWRRPAGWTCWPGWRTRCSTPTSTG
jgi:hypothetical protein